MMCRRFGNCTTILRGTAGWCGYADCFLNWLRRDCETPDRVAPDEWVAIRLDNSITFRCQSESSCSRSAWYDEQKSSILRRTLLRARLRTLWEASMRNSAGGLVLGVLLAVGLVLLVLT